jgi:colanic acid biosynthesis protein WcaH
MFILASEYLRIVEVIPIVCVDLLIINDNKCLLLKRENEPAKGQYWFPGGRIRKNETIEQAALRIAKEETNLNCHFVEKLCVEETIFEKAGNLNSNVHTVNICCKLTIASMTDILKTDQFHSEFKWISQQSNSYHPAVNRPLSLAGFSKIDIEVQ